MTPRWQTTAYYKSLPRWKQVLLENPDLFILKYFGHRIQKLEAFHLRLINAVLGLVRALILYPAGHGKTTLGSTIIPILEVCRDPDVRVAIIGKNETESEGIMRVIQAELVDNADLIRDLGPFKPVDEAKAWALGRIDVAQRKRRGKESTITVFGAGAKTVLGYRTDLTICDDVVTGENSATPTQREKIRNWFDLSVETGPEHADSRLIVVGTRFDPNDLYGDLQEMVDETGTIWSTYREDAVADEERRLTLWPERWPWKRLMQQKAKVGTLSFNKRYRNIAVDSSRMVVREQWVRGGWEGGVQSPGCLDRAYKIGDFDPSWRIVSGFDPAGGGSKNAKFCAHLVVAQASCRDHERCFWIVDITRGQMTLPQMVDLILDSHDEYSLQSSVIEANSFQVGLFQAVQQKMEDRGVQVVVEPHYTTRTNKPDPEVGVGAMSPWFEKGQVHIPWGDETSRRKMQVFVDEIIQYPDARTSDTVMAFWFAWKKLMDSAPVFKSFNRLDGDKRAFIPRRGRFLKNPYYAKEAA